MTAENAKKLIRRKREKTSEKNLFRQGASYYFRKGDFERSLGTFPSEKVAIAYKRVFEQKLDGIGAQAYKFKAKDVWPDYEQSRQKLVDEPGRGRESLSKRTAYEMKSIWQNHLEGFFGPKKLADIDTPLWNKYVEQSEIGDLTNHRKVLGTFLRWCVDQGYTRQIPLMKVPKIERRVRPIMPPETIKKVLAASDGPLLLFVSIYLFMGVRWGEIIQIRWDSINFESNTMTIRKETSKTRKARSLPINSFVQDLLMATRADQKTKKVDSPWVFPKAGKPQEHRYPTSIYLSWKRMTKRVGLKGFTPHDLRATYEYFANKRSDFTDSQREAMAGAAIEVQRKHYVTFEADDVRGLEQVVTFSGLEKVIESKLSARSLEKQETGKTRVSKNLTGKKTRAFQKRKTD